MGGIYTYKRNTFLHPFLHLSTLGFNKPGALRMAKDGPFHTSLCRVHLLGVVTGNRKEGCRIKRLGRAGLDKARGGLPWAPPPRTPPSEVPEPLHQGAALSVALGRHRCSICIYWSSELQDNGTQVWVKAVLRAETAKAHACTLPRSRHSEQTSVKGHFPQSWENWAGPGYWITLACDNSIEIMWKTVLTIHAEVFTGKKLRLSGAH